MTIAIVEVRPCQWATQMIFNPDESIIEFAWAMGVGSSTLTVEQAIQVLRNRPGDHIVIRSVKDIAAVENWPGYQCEAVRAMAAELRLLFPAEPEAEPDEEYIERRVDDNVVVCSNCKYPAPTRKIHLGGCGPRFRCEVCHDMPEAEAVRGLCHQTNTFLAAIEKIRPAEGELATPAELKTRVLNRNGFGKFRGERDRIVRYARGNQSQLDAYVMQGLCQYVADLFDIMDSEVSDV